MKPLRNIGPKSAAWLEKVGICTRKELLKIGVVPAFLRVIPWLPPPMAKAAAIR